MKLNRYSPLFTLVFFVVGACEDKEVINYPIEPAIEFISVKFFEASDSFNPDSLVLRFSFKDGDGNLGFNSFNIDSVLNGFSTPYSPEIFFLTGDNNELIEIGTDYHLLDTVRDSGTSEVPLTILNAKGATGTLVNSRTRNIPGFDFLPEVNKTKLSCIHYTTERIFLPIAQRGLLDEHVNIVNTVTDQNNNQYLQIKDTLYFKRNPNHFNIEVDFLVLESDNSFIEFDWVENYCATFDGRFSSFQRGERKDGPFIINASSTKSGNITYVMRSNGFKSIFTNRALKLRFSIRDRSLNTSNIVETPTFTLMK